MHARWVRAIACLHTFVVAANTDLTFGQCPPHWRPGLPVVGADGDHSSSVMFTCSTAWDPDGGGPLPAWFVAGGNFTVAGDQAVRNIAGWDGTVWHTFNGGLLSASGGPLGALAVFRGQLIAGGRLSVNGEITAAALWNGSTWEPVPGGPNGYIISMSVYEDQLIVGGVFDSCGDTPTVNIARWNGQQWLPLGSGIGVFAEDYVETFQELDGDLYVGGLFYTAGGQVSPSLARWDGAQWHAVGGGFADFVDTLAVYDGELIASGPFNDVNGLRVNRIARLHNGAWTPLGGGLCSDQDSYGGWAESLTVLDGQLYAGGSFALWADAAPGDYVARWDGISWQPVGGGMSNAVRSMQVIGTELFAIGDFPSAGNTVVRHVARWNGTTWLPLGPGYSARIDAMTVANGVTYAVGTFGDANGVRHHGAAQWNPELGRWTPIPGETASSNGNTGGLRSIAWFNDELYIGGFFESVGGVPAANIARWNGQEWRPLGSGTTPGHTVVVMLPFGNALIAGGNFGNAGGLNVGNIARWTGSEWQAMYFGLPGLVEALTVYDGQLIAGGNFGGSGSTNFNGVARWDGSTWLPLGIGMAGGFATDVYTLTAYGSNLVAAGRFEQAGGVAARNIARWDGTQWSAFGEGADGWVHSLAVFDGDLIAGGMFNSIDGQPVGRLARYGEEGWTALGSPNSDVRDLAVNGDELVVGGPFSIIDNRISAGFARFGSCNLTGDLNCDAAVGLSDLTVLLSHFGQTSGTTPADGNLDGDDDVDLADLALLLANFGTTCP